MAANLHIDALLIDALYGELSPQRRVELEAHFAAHPSDRDAFAGWQRVRSLVAEAGLAQVSAAPPAVSAQLLQFAAKHAPSRTSWWTRLLASFAAHPALAAAATVVVTVGIGSVLYLRQGVVQTTRSAQSEVQHKASPNTAVADGEAARAVATSPTPSTEGDGAAPFPKPQMPQGYQVDLEEPGRPDKDAPAVVGVAPDRRKREMAPTRETEKWSESGALGVAQETAGLMAPADDANEARGAAKADKVASVRKELRDALPTEGAGGPPTAPGAPAAADAAARAGDVDAVAAGNTGRTRTGRDTQAVAPPPAPVTGAAAEMVSAPTMGRAAASVAAPVAAAPPAAAGGHSATPATSIADVNAMLTQGRCADAVTLADALISRGSAELRAQLASLPGLAACRTQIATKRTASSGKKTAKTKAKPVTSSTSSPAKAKPVDTK